MSFISLLVACHKVRLIDGVNVILLRQSIALIFRLATFRSLLVEARRWRWCDFRHS